MIGSSSTAKGIEEYLVLLSISETCKLRGEDFLGFMRSGAADFAGLVGHRRGQEEPKSGAHAKTHRFP